MKERGLGLRLGLIFSSSGVTNLKERASFDDDVIHMEVFKVGEAFGE